MPRRTLVPVVFGALVAIGIGIWLGLAVIPWFPVQASLQAKNTDRLYYVLVVASVVIFVIVMTAMLFSVWQFRMRPGQELQDGAPIHGNTRLEVMWTVLPAILVLGLLSYSFVILHDNEKKPAGVELNVDVTGQQFAWYYRYPTSITGSAPINSYVLYLPINQSVRFAMRSPDVIHAFWIPAFRLQEDVVPGITTNYRVTPTRLGTYPIVCNLLCGVGHSLMRSTVIVVSQAKFHAWIASQEKLIKAGHGVQVPLADPFGASTSASAGASASASQSASGTAVASTTAAGRSAASTTAAGRSAASTTAAGRSAGSARTAAVAQAGAHAGIRSAEHGA